MIFSSPEFLYAFLPAAFALFLAARRSAGLATALGVLTLTSLAFYAWWNPWNTLVLLSSVGSNWAFARLVGPDRRWRRPALAVGIAWNLALLGWFKYAAFVAGTLAELGLLKSPFAAPLLPLGISFFTFQQIAYLVDISRGDLAPAPAPRHLLFVAFFPHLIAGPITHPATVLPQFDRAGVTWAGCAEGLFILAVGLAKKSVLADPLGEYIAPGFDAPASLATLNAWAVVAAYTVQMYLDFSAYSDMAVGLGLLFGIRLPWNFLSPYKSTNLADFWRRWHITLSNFLRDYLYFPLGGSRRGPAREAINIFVVMFLSGLWHGADWKYIVWGALHGVALVICRLWQRAGLPMFRPLGWALTVGTFGLLLVLFRAKSIHLAGDVYGRLITVDSRGFAQPLDGGLWRAAPYFLAGLVVTFACPNTRTLSERFWSHRFWPLWGAALLVLSAIYVLGLVNPPEFLYFEF